MQVSWQCRQPWEQVLVGRGEWRWPTYFWQDEQIQQRMPWLDVLWPTSELTAVARTPLCRYHLGLGIYNVQAVVNGMDGGTLPLIIIWPTSTTSVNPMPHKSWVQQLDPDFCPILCRGNGRTCVRHGLCGYRKAPQCDLRDPGRGDPGFRHCWVMCLLDTFAGSCSVVFLVCFLLCLMCKIF